MFTSYLFHDAMIDGLLQANAPCRSLWLGRVARH
jgi:hypothetical protein